MGLDARLATFGAIALLLMLSFGCVSAGSAWGSGGVWLPGWSTLVVYALGIAFLLYTIGYMAAIFLGDDNMKAWVRKEVGQAFYSMLIILIVVGLVGALDAILKSVIIASGNSNWQNYVQNTVCCQAGAPSCIRNIALPCHVEMAQDYLQMMYEAQRTTALSFFTNHYFTSFFSSLNIGIGTRVMVHLGGVNVRPFAGMALGSDFFSILFDLTIKNMMLTRLQQLFLEYIVVGFFPALLSIGLVMRIFYFTRKLGGTLIALALCMYYVYPLFYVLSDSIFFEFTGGWIALPSEANPGLTVNNPTGATLPYMNGQITVGDTNENVFQEGRIKIADFCMENGQPTATPEEQASWAAAFANFQNNWESVRSGGQLLYLQNFLKVAGGPSSAFAPDGPMGNVASLMIYTLIIPFLGLMVTLAAFKTVSPLLGGDVELAIISRLI